MRRRVGLFFVSGLVLSLAVAATAAGQGSTLQVNDQTPAPGQVITVTGNNFSGAAGTSPVEIRLSTRSGRILASPDADPSSSISATFPVPASLRPGWYLLVATQINTVNGRQRSFTPGRTRIRVSAGSAGAAAPRGGGWGGLPGSLPGFLAVGSGLLLLATGATLTARRLRTNNGPQLGC